MVAEYRGRLVHGKNSSGILYSEILKSEQE